MYCFHFVFSVTYVSKRLATERGSLEQLGLKIICTKYCLTNDRCFLEPRASFVKKLPDITLAVQGSDIKLTVELSTPDIPVKWLRYS